MVVAGSLEPDAGGQPALAASLGFSSSLPIRFSAKIGMSSLLTISLCLGGPRGVLNTALCHPSSENLVSTESVPSHALACGVFLFVCLFLPFPFLDFVCGFRSCNRSLLWWLLLKRPLQANNSQYHPVI